MSKKQARQLVLVLSAQRVPFTLSRKDSTYVIQFPQGHALEIARAIGDAS